MMESLFPVPPMDHIRRRLAKIFPEGTENRSYVVRDMAASTVFVMLYVGAIEGAGRWIRPDQVTKMSDAQSIRTTQRARERWAKESLVPGGMKGLRGRWYAANTREPIRDETLRSGLVALGAVVERQDIPTTSAKPRYALQSEFAALLKAELAPARFSALARVWREKHLRPEAIARIRLRNRGSGSSGSYGRVLVRMPNGEVRQMAPGPSSLLSQAVIENFAPKFLKEPAVVFLSESSRKVVASDEQLARKLGLRIAVDRNLPDIILADIGVEPTFLVFVEVVATDGPVTRERKEALLGVTDAAGFSRDGVLFLSAFADRGSPECRRLSPSLAWGTAVWYASEPEHIVLYAGTIPMERLIAIGVF